MNSSPVPFLSPCLGLSHPPHIQLSGAWEGSLHVCAEKKTVSLHVSPQIPLFLRCLPYPTSLAPEARLSAAVPEPGFSHPHSALRCSSPGLPGCGEGRGRPKPDGSTHYLCHSDFSCWSRASDSCKQEEGTDAANARLTATGLPGQESLFPHSPTPANLNRLVRVPRRTPELAHLGIHHSLTRALGTSYPAQEAS